MNSDGSGDLGDRLEILLGPDCFGRCDLLLFKGKGVEPFSCELPKDFELPIVDKRKEIEDYLFEGQRKLELIINKRSSSEAKVCGPIFIKYIAKVSSIHITIGLFIGSKIN